MILKQFAQEKELFMYVAEDATYATGNQAIFKASDFVGATTPSSTTTVFRFYAQDKSKLGIGGDPSFDSFTLTHTEDAHIEVMKAVASVMSNPHGGFVVVQDDLGTAFSADGSGNGASMSDINYAAIASTGTAVSCTAVAITTVDA